MSQPFDVAALAATYANKSPQDILKLAFEHFGDDLWVSFSGAEDVVLVDMAWKLNKQVKVFSLDTGRLHPETYRFIDQVREQYALRFPIRIAGLQAACAQCCRLLGGDFVVGDQNAAALAAVGSVEQVDGVERGAAARKEIHDQGVGAITYHGRDGISGSVE